MQDLIQWFGVLFLFVSPAVRSFRFSFGVCFKFILCRSDGRAEPRGSGTYTFNSLSLECLDPMLLSGTLFCSIRSHYFLYFAWTLEFKSFVSTLAFRGLVYTGTYIADQQHNRQRHTRHKLCESSTLYSALVFIANGSTIASLEIDTVAQTRLASK